MQEYTLETKTRYATVCKYKNVITGNYEWLVGIFSKISGKILANYRLTDYPNFKSYTALVAFAKENDLDNALPSPNTAMELPSDCVAVEGNPSPVATGGSGDTPLDTAFIFKIADKTQITLIRHDWSFDYIKVQRFAFDEYRSTHEFDIPYSHATLSLLLSARTAKTLYELSKQIFDSIISNSICEAVYDDCF